MQTELVSFMRINSFLFKKTVFGTVYPLTYSDILKSPDSFHNLARNLISQSS